MPRMLDCDCDVCDYKVRDKYVVDVAAALWHDDGNGNKHSMHEVYIPHVRNAEWSDGDAVVVYRKPDGTYAYPGRNDQATPAGCERVVLKSLRAVEQFEKASGTRNEAIWFDRGSGRGFDSEEPQLRRPSEEQRLRKFMESWQG